MKESVHHINITLAGILSEPDTEILSCKTVVVFLHGIAGYRIGPHRMLTQFARDLAGEGFYCMRFDFSGKGYNSHFPIATDQNSMLQDLAHVIHFVNSKLEPDHIVLAGLCLGGTVAIYGSALAKNISRLILLAPSALYYKASAAKEVKTTLGRLRGYWQKMAKAETYRKIIAGRVNYSLIARFLISPFTSYFRSKCFPDKQEAGDSTKKNPVYIAPLQNFNGSILIIFGDRDPEFEASSHQIKSLCDSNGVNYQLKAIPGANHSFYSIEWKKQILLHIKEWMLAPKEDRS